MSGKTEMTDPISSLNEWLMLVAGLVIFLNFNKNVVWVLIIYWNSHVFTEIIISNGKNKELHFWSFKIYIDLLKWNDMKWNLFFFSKICINLQQFQVIPENKTKGKL